MVYLDKQTIKQIIEAFNQGNFEPSSKLFSEDVTLHCPGRNRISGDYQGKAGVIDFWKKQIAITNNNFKAEVVAVSQGEGSLVLIIEITTQVGDQRFSWRRVNHYKVIDGRVVEAWIYEGDQYIADTVFS